MTSFTQQSTRRLGFMQGKSKRIEEQPQPGRSAMFNNKDAQPAQEQEQDGADFDFFNQLLASIDNPEEKPEVQASSD